VCLKDSKKHLPANPGVQRTGLRPRPAADACPLGNHNLNVWKHTHADHAILPLHFVQGQDRLPRLFGKFG
jgi:hypothetical protein